MKKRICLFTAALCSAAFVLMASTSYAQKAGGMSKAEAIAQQLNLTPQQKIKILPILRDEVPKVNGFFSIYPRECGELNSILYVSTNVCPPALADFMSVSQLTGQVKSF